MTSQATSLRNRAARFLNRYHARMAARARSASAFVSAPEPRSIGNIARGRQMVAGNYQFAGHLVSDPQTLLWDIDPPDLAFSVEIHGFDWLGDLAAVGDVSARALAVDCLWGWIERYSAGEGAGWRPDLTGRRVIRWIHHALFVLRGQDGDQAAAFYNSLSHQTWFLARRWKNTPPGLPRFEALCGLIYAGMSLQGLEQLALTASASLARECALQLDEQGGLVTRNPEELLEVFTLLIWAATALDEAGQPIPEEHRSAVMRIAPVLRGLRHADGTLARFHGGGPGAEGVMDQALAASGVRDVSNDGLAMGFARLSSGRTSLIIDASPPPTGKTGGESHASTLGCELTSGRRPIIVSCGSGATFGTEWRRAGRATPSHATLSLDGRSSATLAPPDTFFGRETLINAPTHVPAEVTRTDTGQQFQGSHDGYVSVYGLTHARTLELSFDGRRLDGEDMLFALDAPQRKRFDQQFETSQLEGIRFDIRFHLHPDVEAELDMGGTAASLLLKSGEVWVFRSVGVQVRLEPSVYLQAGRLKPRTSEQIVLSGWARDYDTRVQWSLSKPQETAIGLRDLVQETVSEFD